MAYKLTKRTATVYGIRIDKPSTWADITIEEWTGGGSFKCISDCGNYAFIWGSIGNDLLRSFLCSLNFDYFMNKVTSHDYLEFNFKKQVKRIEEMIIRDRKDRSLDKALAAECWAELHEICAGDFNEFYDQLRYTDNLFKLVFDEDPTAVPHEESPKAQCTAFWNEIWPVACEIWREELQQQAAVNHEQECPKNPYKAEIARLRGVMQNDILSAIDDCIALGMDTRSARDVVKATVVKALKG
jgi:hypothetical protein